MTKKNASTEPVPEVIIPEVLPDQPEAKQLELQVLKNETVFLWNFEEIKTVVQAHIQNYVGLAVTEENLKSMEGAQKELAGVRTKIDTFRKYVKKQMEVPYNKFEGEIKELQQLVEKAETPLKTQIQKFEDQRVANLDKELTEFAKKTAGSLGLRDEYFKFAVQAKWTNRSAKKTAVRKEIVTEIEGMLEVQKQADELQKQAEEKEKLIAYLCDFNKTVYMLKTAINPEEIKHLTENAGLAEIPNIVMAECQKRKELEVKAAAESAAPVTVPVMEEPDKFDPPTPPMPIMAMPRTNPAARPSVPPPMPPASPMPPQPFQGSSNPPVPALWDVTLKLPAIDLFQAAAFKNFLGNYGIRYEVIDQKKVN